MEFFGWIFGIVLVSIIGGIIINHQDLQAKRLKHGRKDQDLEELHAKLDKVIARVETLERLATDEDTFLKREFKEMDRHSA